MSLLDLGKVAKLLADLGRIEDPVSLLGDGFEPLFVLKARINTEDILEEGFFAEVFNLLLELYLFSIRVDIINATNLVCAGEKLPTGEATDLVEYWVQILVLRRDELVILKTAFLQDTIEGDSLVTGLSTAVKESEAFEEICVNLNGSVSLLLVFEGTGGEELIQATIRFRETLPRWSGQLSLKCFDCNETFASAVFLSVFNFRQETADQSP